MTRPQRELATALTLLALSVGVMMVDYFSDYAQPLRSSLSYLTGPIQETAIFPQRVYDWYLEFTGDESELRSLLADLQSENLQLTARMRTLASIRVENARLRELLGTANSLQERVLLAELLEVSLDPYTHKVVINKGTDDGIYVGQAVIDINGIMGQVTGVTPGSSAVTLLTDPNHAIPVQVLRSGLRGIAHGQGVAEVLSLPYLAHHADIQLGDLLVTSGMGGRFPFGYPVARVSEIRRDTNEAFLGIQARPVANLDHARHVLLIRYESTDETADSGAPGSTNDNRN